MLERVKKILTSKNGISLMETLISLTLLAIMIFCFLPLFAQYLKHIKKAGEIAKDSQYKVSVMERLVANRGDSDNRYYETSVSEVPIVFKSGADSISFNTTEENTVSGAVITSNYETGGDHNYATFFAANASAHMVCFPNELTDDFIQKEIVVVAKGFHFQAPEDASGNVKNASESGYHFKVYYTNSGGGIQPVQKEYYDIRYEYDGDEKIAIFTFYGGNNVITFENSPLYIKYGSGNTDALQYSVKVEIGAPEIIMVGEKASNGKYYYYSTSGVDENGNMDIIAKEMTSAPLNSAMNDVEWVEKGMGDDGNGNTNKYGYYIMGGDAGQVRRFWKNNETGNYYWGGDYLNNYNCKIDEAGGSSHETFNRALTTQANYKMIYRGKASQDFAKNRHNVLFDSDKITIGYKYQAVTFNYFTANVGAGDEYYLTMAGAFKNKNLLGSKYEYYGFHADMKRDEYNNITGWISNGSIGGSKLNIDGYKEATNYEYSGDNSLITITSVGAIPVNTSNIESGSKKHLYTATNETSIYGTANVSPTKSYSLYCGYIPLVTDVYGWKTSNAGGWSIYVHVGTIGAAYSSNTNSWYPTGKFGDLYTNSTTLNSSIFPSMAYSKLLNYYDTNKFDTGRDNVYPYPSKNNNTYNYKPSTTVNGVNVAGQALTGQGEDYYLTGQKEIDVTMGYLSEPFAITVNNPEVPTISGMTGADYYFEKFNNASGKFDHAFFSSGLRNNVTMLDVKSFHDDITGNNISFSVGYSLSYIFGDYSWATRIYQVYNTGLVYIRATGNGTESDTAGSLDSGKGWSMERETNIFHQFFGQDQYLGNNQTSKDGTKAILGWDTTYHRSYFNISSSDGKAPQSGYTPTIEEGSTSYGTNCHPMMDTKCNTVNKGITHDEKPEIMWGTENGTVLSWKYDYENLKGSKITAVKKEFENYIWIDRLGGPTSSYFANNKAADGGYYDYPSVSAGKSSNYGFISPLKSINDVAYGDGVWVAVGEQGYKERKDGTAHQKIDHIDPSDYCAVNAVSVTPGLTGGRGSYINVKYEVEGETCSDGSPFYAWKTVKVSEYENIDFISVTYAKGVWYALGFDDKNHNGKNDYNGTARIFYSTDPVKGWYEANTATTDASGKVNYSQTATALYFDGSGVKSIDLKGANSMASRG